ncbi:MAG: imidazolonepropionase [Candidatus Aminicenantales bacterium]
MISADCIVSNCRQLITCRGPLPKRNEGLRDLGVIEDGWIASNRGKIVFVGKGEDFRKEVQAESAATWIDGRDSIALPGLVDCHTHLPFAGNREHEFLLRLQGRTYQELAAQGMGIQTTVKATREATKEDLVHLCRQRLNQMLLTGTTTVEAKSGYGLNLDDEIKQLEALKDLRGTHPIEVVPTYMGAHEIPPEFKGNKAGYIDLIIRRVLPEIQSRGLAEFFDIFCEPSVFTLEETKALAEAARAAGLGVKIHADEFVPIGGARYAAESGAMSVEHLIRVTEDGIRAIGGSRTAAILLPGVPFFLMLDTRAPARKLIEAGAIVALASDFNPGSSMLSSMLLVLQLGVYTLRMTIEEAINACTANAAYAINRDAAIGSLEVGKSLDLLICDVQSYASLIYQLGVNPVRHVIKDGKIVVRAGKIQPL